MIVGVVTAFPGTPLGTIRESSSSWGSPRSTENPASLPTCKGDGMLLVSDSCASDTPPKEGAPMHREQRGEGAVQLSFSHEAHKKEEQEACGSLHSPADSVSEVAESIAILSQAGLSGSVSPVSVISEVISEAGSAVQAVSPVNAFASDDAQSAAYLTSSEPSRASSFTAQAPSRVPSPASGAPGDANVPSVTYWASGHADAPGTAPAHVDVTHQQQHQQQQHQQQQQQDPSTVHLPQLLSELCKSELVASALHSAAMQPPAEATAAVPDPVLGASPARGAYDPERYKPYTPPAAADAALETQTQPPAAQPVSTQPHLLSERAGVPISEHQHDAHALPVSPQSQTQLVGHSPKQAALLRLRSLTVRHSQTVKATSTSQAPQLLAEATPKPATHPSNTIVNCLEAITRPPNTLSADQQDTHTATHDSTAKLEVLSAVGNPKASSQQNRSTAGGNSQALCEQQVNPTTAEGDGTICHHLPGLVSPRRSTSVAKLRSQSLAKQRMDPRFVSLRRLPLVPIPAAGTDGSQQLIHELPGCHASDLKEAEDVGTAVRPQNPDEQSDHGQGDKPCRQPIAESAAGSVTTQEAGDAGATFKQQCSTTHSVATARVADRADSQQPCPSHEAAAIDLADIHVVVNTDCLAPTSAVAAPEMPTSGVTAPGDTTTPWEPPAISQTTPSAETLSPVLSRQPGTDIAPESTHQLPTSSSRAGHSGSIRLSSKCDSSPLLAHHTRDLRSACFHHADDSSMQKKALRQSDSSNSAVAVSIRATGMAASLSLQVQELSAQDSPAENAAGVARDSTAEKAAEVTHAAAVRAGAPEDDATHDLQAGLFPATADGEGPVEPNVHTSNPSQPGRAAAANCSKEEEDSPGQQPTAAPVESTCFIHDAVQEDRAVPSSPKEDSPKAVSSSPGKRGLMGRLEGGLRSWLGRGSKQLASKDHAAAQAQPASPHGDFSASKHSSSQLPVALSASTAADSAGSKQVGGKDDRQPGATKQDAEAASDLGVSDGSSQAFGGNLRVSGANLGVSGANSAAPGTNSGVAGSNSKVPGANSGMPGANSGVPGTNPWVAGANVGMAGVDSGVPGAKSGFPGANSRHSEQSRAQHSSHAQNPSAGHSGQHVPRVKKYALARLKSINCNRQLTSLSTTRLHSLRNTQGLPSLSHASPQKQSIPKSITRGSPMQAYANPAFHPSFVSRIPKPAPRQPRQAKNAQPFSPAGEGQQPLQELPSTSQMQPAVLPHALPAGFETRRLSQEAQQAQHGAGQADRNLLTLRPAVSQIASVSTTQQQREQDDSTVQLFQRPGHEVVSVVWEESHDRLHESRQHADHAAASSAGHAVHAGPAGHAEMGSLQGVRDAEGQQAPDFADMCRRLGAVIEGARVRHRLRQPACKALCNEILQMQQAMIDPKSTQNVAESSDLHRQLMQQLRIRRIQLGELLASALPVPQALPITRPLPITPSGVTPQPPPPATLPAPHLPSFSSAQAGPSTDGPPRADANAPSLVPSAGASTSGLDHAQRQGQMPGECPSALCEAGPSGRSALKGVGIRRREEEGAAGEIPVEKAKQAVAAAARGMIGTDHSILQAVSAAAQKQLQEVQQQLSQGFIDSPRAVRLKGAPQQAPILARAASNSPRATTDSPRAGGLSTPSPFSSSRDAGGAQTAPESTTGAEGSCDRKPFLRRRSRHVPVSQRLNWSEVKPRTQCRLEPSYIPVTKTVHHRSSSDKAADQDAASPKSPTEKVHSRKAWGSNQPNPRRRPGPSPKPSLFQPADYQSPYAATPSSTSGKRQRGRTSDSVAGQPDSVSASSNVTPGPLDDILGQVTDLLSQVNDILGR
ncbi:hypothetical protein ABBQ38_007905 [Trebouxia sp. C0009 RCD-2024]